MSGSRAAPGRWPYRGAAGYQVGIIAVVAVTRLLADWQVEGIEHVPTGGPLIVAANHFSFVDPPLLGASLPRRLTFFAKAELWRNPLTRLFCETMGVMPLRRGEADRSALRQAVAVLDAGGAIGLFPEGTRGRDRPRVLKPAKPGAAFLAVRAGAPVLPVGIAGTDVIDSPAALLLRSPRRPRLRVRIGRPLHLTGASRRDQDAATQRVMEEIARLLPPHYRGAYALPD